MHKDERVDYDNPNPNPNPTVPVSVHPTRCADVVLTLCQKTVRGGEGGSACLRPTAVHPGMVGVFRRLTYLRLEKSDKKIESD